MQNWLRDTLAGGYLPMGVMGGSSTYGTTLRAYSPPFFTHEEKKIQEINYGGKAILPSSVLDHMLQLNSQSPVMLFKIFNPSVDHQRATHCGVLEFSAEEGRCYIPQWIMTQLGLQDGDEVRVESTRLPKATFAKLKPQSMNFLDISNPRAILEVELRKWACLTKNDRIQINYNAEPLELVVQDLKPENAVCIVECDVNLEFDAPEGYKEPTRPGPSSTTVKPPAPAATTVTEAPPAATGFIAFGGGGVRLDGKTLSSGSLVSAMADATEPTLSSVPYCRADYKPGTLTFIRYDYRSLDVQLKELREKATTKACPSTSAFSGSGATIRRPRY